MRVSLLTQSLQGGGAEQVCLNWAMALRGAGHDVTVVTFRQNASPERARLLHDQGVSIAQLPTTATSPIAKVVFLRKYLHRESTDVLVSLLTFPNLVSLVAALGSKSATVISEHNVPSILLRRQGLSQRIQLHLARRLYRNASHVIAVSHAVAADLACNFAVEGRHATVLPNAIFPTTGISAAGLEAVPRSSVRLVVPARITPQKRPLFALSIAEELALRGHDVSLRYIGDPSPAFPDTSVLQSSTVSVSVDTWDPEWPADVPKDAVLLLPSDVEGLGNVLVEAAAAGVKAVAGSWALGVSDAVVPGVTGVLARSDTPHSFADAVEDVFRIESGSAVQSWLRTFSTEAVAVQLNHIVMTAVARRRRKTRHGEQT